MLSQSLSKPRPRASVILPIFNAAPYLSDAIQSVLAQSFTDFECLLLNDGSTDGSAAIIDEFVKIDIRCKAHSWPNHGLIETLNRGLELAAGDIIFRMDADDICRPDRFVKQFSYLENHSDCVAVGSRLLLIDDSGMPICDFGDYQEHADIDAAHLAAKGGSLPHPAVAMRRNAVQSIGGYRRGFDYAEDIDLFLRLAEVGKLANLPEVLLHYRQHLNSIGYRHAHIQNLNTIRAVAEARARRGLKSVALSVDLPTKTAVDSLSSRHRKWAWWALDAINLKTARKHAWRAVVAKPFDIQNLKLLFCVLRGR